jgi:hypothetical protein
VNDESGHSVSTAGDVNGDGLDDLIIGALNADPSNKKLSAGKSYVVFGKIDNTTIELSTIANGTGGFIINGQIQYDRSGASVSVISCSVSLPATSVATMVTVSLSCADVCIVL